MRRARTPSETDPLVRRGASSSPTRRGKLTSRGGARTSPVARPGLSRQGSLSREEEAPLYQPPSSSSSSAAPAVPVPLSSSTSSSSQKGGKGGKGPVPKGGAVPDRGSKRLKTWVMTCMFVVVLGAGVEAGAIAASLFWIPLWTYIIFSSVTVGIAALLFLPLLHRKSRMQGFWIILTAVLWILAVAPSGLYLGHEAKEWDDARSLRVYSGSLVNLQNARRLHADTSPPYHSFCFNGTTYFAKEYAQEVVVEKQGNQIRYCTIPLFMSSAKTPSERNAVLGFVGCKLSCTECINEKKSHTCGVRVEIGPPHSDRSQELGAYLQGVKKIQSANGLIPAEPPVFYNMHHDLASEGALYDQLRFRFILITSICWSAVVLSMVVTGFTLTSKKQ